MPRNMGPFFAEKKRRLRQRTQKLRACKNMGAFFAEKKKRLRQRTHKLRACKNLPPWDSGRKTRFSNCPEDNRSKVSVKNMKSGLSLLTFRDISSHRCEIILWIAKSGDLDPDKAGCFQTHVFVVFF